MKQLVDYGKSGLSIQYAMLDHARRFPEKLDRPKTILWNGLDVLTMDVFPVPNRGTVRAEILSAKGEVQQGFDMKLAGEFHLRGGERVSTLRTWNDPLYESTVEYPFVSSDGRLLISNVYRREYAGGRLVEEKWTGNAGMWVEETNERERIFHCSHGMAVAPDFEAFVFKVVVFES